MLGASNASLLIICSSRERGGIQFARPARFALRHQQLHRKCYPCLCTKCYPCPCTVPTPALSRFGWGEGEVRWQDGPSKVELRLGVEPVCVVRAAQILEGLIDITAREE